MKIRSFTFLVWMAASIMLLSCKEGASDDSEKAMQGKGPTGDIGSITEGRIAQTMDSGGYTYMLVEKGADKVWVAIPHSDVKDGQQVSFHPGVVMHNFNSTTLNRTFQDIIFSAGLTSGHGEDAHAGSHGGPMPGEAPQIEGGAGAVKPKPSMPHGSLEASAPPSDLHVEKAEGENGYAVDELFSKGSGLDGQRIRVKGKVVKVSRNIMGRNWIHIQDGTGNPEKKTHDLVLTSQAAPSKGEIVTATGILRADKDFGAGYRYAVIIEEAVFEE